MNCNYYSFLLEDYKKKMDPKTDIITIRKAIAQSIANESFRVRQQFRHEMARKRREELENQRKMNRKMKEIKEKEKEIASRFRMKNSYGHLLGTNANLKKKSKPKEKPPEESITVLLPVIKKNDIESTDDIRYESHSIPKKMLPRGKEDISAYKVVKKTKDLYRKYGESYSNGVSDGIAQAKTLERLALQETVDPLDDSDKNEVSMHLNPRKFKEPPVGHHMQSVKRNYASEPHSVYRNYHYGPSYDNILNYYRNGGGLYRDELAVFGKAKNASKYELLIVDEGPRTEEIRVKQRTVQNPRAFDILTIKENIRSTTPNDW